MRPLRIALVGDHNPGIIAHQSVPRAIELAARELALPLAGEWVPTESIHDVADVQIYDGIWCVPATPYRNADGAFVAIRFARESGRPFLGTCGGFQHALVEYARNVLGLADADHAETNPDAANLVITPLACEMVERSGTVHLMPSTRIAAAYGVSTVTEGYHCRYGLNPAFRRQVESGALRITAVDDAGDVRAVELDGHPFFVATLFQSERRALAGETPPIVREFVRAAAAHASGSVDTPQLSQVN